MSKYKVLLVDDNAQFTENMRGYLMGQERIREVDVAQDGKEATELLREKKYDVMTLDLIMPNMDGLSVLEQIPLLCPQQPPAVVAISALRNETMVRRCCQMGAKYYMVKPIEPDMLYKRLVQMLDNEQPKGGIMPYAQQPKSFDEKVTAVFLVAGIPAHIKGYHYLREGIKMVYNEPDMINRITKELYPGIARHFDTSASKVERAIRHAIEVAWTRGKIENLNALFGYNIYGKNDKPTNGEFIALVADKLLMEERSKKAG